MNERKLRLICETIRTQRGWTATGSTEERLEQLQHDVVWDVGGTVRMLDAARVIEPARVEKALQAGIDELEHIPLDSIAGQVRIIGKRLGNGGPCTTTPASADDAKRARERLKALQIPADLSEPLTARIESFVQRAALVAEGPFHRASCEGPAPVLFGWLDGKPVPLVDLIDAAPNEPPAP